MAVAQLGHPSYSSTMVGDAVSVIQRVVIVIVAVVLIGFGASQMMNDRNRQGLRPQLINLHGIDSPAFSDTGTRPILPSEAPVSAENSAGDYRARYFPPPAAQKQNMRDMPAGEALNSGSAEQRHDPLPYERMDIDDLLKP